jgi:hypothetical protein
MKRFRHKGDIFRRGFAIVAAVVVVTTLRSPQHIDLLDSTRLSIRLSWQSDTPPHRALVSRDDASSRAVAPMAVAEDPPHQGTVQPAPASLQA